MSKVSQHEIPGFGSVMTSKLAILPGLKLKARLAKIVVPAWTQILPVLARMVAKGDVDPEKWFMSLLLVEAEKLVPIVETCLAHIDPEMVPVIVPEILYSTTVIVRGDGEATKYDLCDEGAIQKAFGDNEPALFRAIAYALQRQFTGFFSSKANVQGASAPPAQP